MGFARLVSLAAAAALGLSACVSVVEAPRTSAPARAAAADPLAGMSPAELTAFVRAMPKGGDLHIHLSGAPWPEDYLAWAAEDGLCVDLEALALAAPCTPGETLRPAAGLDADQRAAMLDSLSTRRPDFAGRTGHDQFFTAFDRFGATPDHRRGDMLADLMAVLAAQNTWYVEVMWMPQSRPSRDLGRAAGWRADMAELRAAIAPGIPALVQAAMAETDAVEARARTLLGCDTPVPRPGCEVTVRHLVQANRLVPPEQTFGQLQLGAALIEADPRWVGLQLVAPEDHPNALANYRVHMAMIGLLSERGRRVPVALHAGELTLAYATPADLSFHVREAIETAGATRIGHGVALPHEDGAEALVARMAEAGIAVEVNLTSNDTILGVRGADHPVIWWRRAGVPVVLTTDDPGISRIDLSHEYARAVRETGATYADLVASARAALEHSFLPGPSLWSAPREGREQQPCAGEIGAAAPSPGCRGFLEASPRAREQWRLELRLAEFERARGLR